MVRSNRGSATTRPPTKPQRHPRSPTPQQQQAAQQRAIQGHRSPRRRQPVRHAEGQRSSEMSLGAGKTSALHPTDLVQHGGNQRRIQDVMINGVGGEDDPVPGRSDQVAQHEVVRVIGPQDAKAARLFQAVPGVPPWSAPGQTSCLRASPLPAPRRTSRSTSQPLPASTRNFAADATVKAGDQAHWISRKGAITARR